jgi:hypothetical protein
MSTVSDSETCIDEDESTHWPAATDAKKHEGRTTMLDPPASIWHFRRQTSTTPRVFWAPTKRNEIPPNAVPVGHEKNGEPIYAARALYKGSLVIGSELWSTLVTYSSEAG